MASRTPAFRATPPLMQTSRFTPARFARDATRAATDWQMPATRSGISVPFASWEITSDSANTVHVLEMLAGFSAFDNGSAFVGLLVGCVFVFIIDNDWLKASITNVVALALTGIGMIHSPGLLFTESYSPNLGFVAVYCVLIVGFLVLHLIKFNQKAHQADLEAEKAAALAAAKQE